MNEDQKLIEQAKAGLDAFDAYWGDGGPVDAAYGRPWEIIRRLLAAFEKAHTPTDDERVNAAAMEIYEWSNTISKSGALMLARAALRAAGEVAR